MRIDSDSQLSDGAWGIGRIQGYYYNDSRGPGSGQDYNKYEGDVFAQVRLRYDSDGRMSANAYVERCNDADENSFTTMLSHTFSTPIALDTDYNLSISYNENTLVLACEGETVEYQIATPSYTPYGEHRLLRSRVYLDPGESGYLKTQFDDVYIWSPDLKGDLNFDARISLSDVILGTQILTYFPSGSEPYAEADANMDGKIGLEEIIYDLQIASNNREIPINKTYNIGLSLALTGPTSEIGIIYANGIEDYFQEVNATHALGMPE